MGNRLDASINGCGDFYMYVISKLATPNIKFLIFCNELDILGFRKDQNFLEHFDKYNVSVHFSNTRYEKFGCIKNPKHSIHINSTPNLPKYTPPWSDQ